MVDDSCKDYEGHILSICGKKFMIDKITLIKGGWTIETTSLDELTLLQKCVAFLWEHIGPYMLRWHRYCRRSENGKD